MYPGVPTAVLGLLFSSFIEYPKSHSFTSGLRPFSELSSSVFSNLMSLQCTYSQSAISHARILCQGVKRHRPLRSTSSSAMISSYEPCHVHLDVLQRHP